MFWHHHDQLIKGKSTKSLNDQECSGVSIGSTGPVITWYWIRLHSASEFTSDYKTVKNECKSCSCQNSVMLHTFNFFDSLLPKLHVNFYSSMNTSTNQWLKEQYVHLLENNSEVLYLNIYISDTNAVLLTPLHDLSYKLLLTSGCVSGGTGSTKVWTSCAETGPPSTLRLTSRCTETSSCTPTRRRRPSTTASTWEEKVRDQFCSTASHRGASGLLLH